NKLCERLISIPFIEKTADDLDPCQGDRFVIAGDITVTLVETLNAQAHTARRLFPHVTSNVAKRDDKVLAVAPLFATKRAILKRTYQRFDFVLRLHGHSPPRSIAPRPVSESDVR